MTFQVILNYAYSFLGTPYRWGGDDPMTGIDCSGLALEVLKAAGIYKGSFDTTAQGIHDDLIKRGLAVVTKQPDVLCLAFYGKSGKEITHVGVCVSPTHMIEAGGGGSKVIDLKTASDANAYVRIRPLDHRSDIVSVLEVNYPWEVK
jgi:cell wall-associated NlpC family hydrolase